MHAFVAVHSGAGSCSEKNISRLKKLCETTCNRTLEFLEKGVSAVQAVCFAVAVLEDDPLTNAGLGSNLTRDCSVECDAAVMEARTGHFGGCGAVSGVTNPIYLAQSILENQQKDATNHLGLIPPILLVGPGAQKFAATRGVTIVDPQALVTQERLLKHNRWNALLQSSSTSVPIADAGHDEEMDLDTVGAIVIDGEGNVAVAASSGGILLKYPGRVGQAAIMGAGVWCEETDNDTVACCTSGTGEHLIRCNLARELCRSVALDKSSFMADIVADKFFGRGNLSAETGGRFMGALLLQTSNWKATGKGFLHVIHNTPTLCWATAGTRNRKAKGEMSFNSTASGSLGPSGVVTLGYSI